MEGRKKIAAIAVLVVIIIGAVGTIVSRRFSRDEMPYWKKEEQVEKIDMSDGTLMTLTLEEWMDLGEKASRYKNPETKEYTMVVLVTCAACGEKVIPVEFPDPPPVAKSREEYFAQRGKYEAELARLIREYKCPKCGELAYSR